MNAISLSRELKPFFKDVVIVSDKKVEIPFNLTNETWMVKRHYFLVNVAGESWRIHNLLRYLEAIDFHIESDSSFAIVF